MDKNMTTAQEKRHSDVKCSDFLHNGLEWNHVVSLNLLVLQMKDDIWT